jgi:hypothetical protein
VSRDLRMPYMHPTAAGQIEELMFQLNKRGAGDIETRVGAAQPPAFRPGIAACLHVGLRCCSTYA